MLRVFLNNKNNTISFKECITKENIMNIKMLKAALAGLVLSVSGFANAGLIFSNVSVTSDSLTFTINGDLSGYDLSNTQNGSNFGLRYFGDLFILPTNEYRANIWSDTVFSSNSVLTGNTGTFGSLNAYTWANTSSALTNSDYTTQRAVTLSFNTLVDVFNINSTNGRVEFIAGWGNSNTTGRVEVLGTHHFRDSQEVPEPSTLAIFALGIIGLATRRFKKQS